MPVPPPDPADLVGQLQAVQRDLKAIRNVLFRHGDELYGEQWHKVGDPGEPAFTNGFTAQTTRGVRFYQDSLGNVHLQGIAEHLAGDSAAAIFQLPVGYRPDVPVGDDVGPFPALGLSNAAGYGTYRVTIGQNGQVFGLRWGVAGGVYFVALDGVVFRTARSH